MLRQSAETLAAVLVLACYVWAASWHLGTVPSVHEDEPWQASTGWKLATTGVLGSDVFAGLHEMEEHYYGYMPLHAFALASQFRLGGVGLVQARLVGVVAGLATLLLAWGLARRLAGPPAALLTIALLTGASVTGLTTYHTTGIPMIDTARIARYDILVPVFGLAALHLHLDALRRQRASLHALSGLLVGLAGLSHVYGAFWLAAFAAVLAWKRAGLRPLVALLTGCAIPWLAYAAYVLQDVEAWRGQMAGYAPRFDLLDWRFYWDNLRQEPLRYFAGMRSGGWPALTRPGVWAGIAAVAATLTWLVHRSIRGDDRARALLVPLAMFPAMFALLLRIKIPGYMVLFVPVTAVAVSWALVSLWSAAAARGRRWPRVAVGVGLAVVLAEGGLRVAHLGRLAEATTPAHVLSARLHAPIPAGSRVLGLHAYWFGFEDTDYRSWAVPWLQAFPDYGPARPIEDALDALAPQFIIVDPRMRAAFAGAPERARRAAAWMQHRGFVTRAVIDDSTYGRFEVLGRRDEVP